ncbi:Endonuclease/exonuclease/phosphatase superfamily [Sesbania bispinosa]|nr:Endonuclease/exonuclease/phosphatase superfamily [Sesbania bispinosa]
MGDFNELLSQAEKDGLRPQNRKGMDLFNNFVSDSGLMELYLKGCKYTSVSNQRNGFITREKLDRVLVNWSWRDLFPNAMAIALPPNSFDHSLIIMWTNKRTTSVKNFKYEAMWDDEDECWHKRTFKQTDLELNHLNEELQAILNQGNGGDELCWSRVVELRRQIDRLRRQKEIYWAQRSRVKWLNFRDRNTGFFHASTVQRRDRNKLYRLRNDQGTWVEGQNEVENLILSHFQEVYKSDGPINFSSCESAARRKITDAINEELMRPTNEEEVKRAVFSMGAFKAPVTDGLNGLFFQNHWEVLKADVVAVVEDFFIRGILPEELNETLGNFAASKNCE